MTYTNDELLDLLSKLNRSKPTEKLLRVNTINYEEKLKHSKYRLKKYGFAQLHENRITVKSDINRTSDTNFYNLKSDNQDIDYILIKAVDYFGIPDFLADRAKFILAKTWNRSGQKQNFNRIPCELAALGCLMYCCHEDLPENTTVDFEELIKTMYPKDKIKKRMKQFRRAHSKIIQLNKTEDNPVKNNDVNSYYLTSSEKINLMENYTLRHGTILVKLKKVEILYNRYHVT